MEQITANKTKERAHEIINIYVNAAKDIDFIKAIILVGSLSDDTYTGNAGSDIDLVHIVSDDKDYITEKKTIFDLIDRVEEQTNHDIPISKTVFCEKQLRHPYEYDFELTHENKDLIERPIEVFRVLDSGMVLLGDEHIKETIERPTREDVIKSKHLEEDVMELLRKENPKFTEEYEKAIENPSLRMLTQIVLVAALSDYYFYTNKSCSSKYRILESMEKDCPKLPYLNLLRLCHKNRFTPDEMMDSDIAAMKEEYRSIFRNRPKTW